MKFSRLIFISIISALLTQPISAMPVQSTDMTATKPQDKAAAEHYYQQGLQFLKDGNLPMAKKAYSVSLENSTDYPKAMLGLAEVAYKENNLKEAENWITYAVDKQPNDAYVLASYARLLYLKGDYKETEKILLEALKIDPKIISTQMALGDLYMGALKQPEKAIKIYDKVIQSDPKHAGARYALGMALLANKDTKNAQQELLTASKLAPRNPLPYFTLGDIASGEKQFDKALGYYNKVLSIDSTNIKTLAKRAAIYTTMGKDNLAIRDYEAAAAVNRELPEINLNLGMLYQKHGKYRNATKAYQRVIKQAPDALLAYNNLAWMAAESGTDLTQATEWANKATQLAPESSAVYDTLGWVYRAKKDYKSAVSAFKKSISLDPKNAAAHYHLGLTYIDQRDKTQAVKALNNAIKLDKNSQVAKLANDSLSRL